MPANIDPIYALTPNISGLAIGGAANTKADGQGTIATDIFKVFTAGSNGSWVYKIRLQPVAVTAGTATTATVHRIYISTQTSGATTQTNTWNIAEVGAASQTADSSSAATNFIDIPLNFALPASYTILVSSHAANAASTSWTATVFAGDY